MRDIPTGWTRGDAGTLARDGWVIRRRAAGGWMLHDPTGGLRAAWLGTDAECWKGLAAIHAEVTAPAAHDACIVEHSGGACTITAHTRRG